MKTTTIKVLHIEPGAQYDNYVWDYWIIAALENGEVITIFDSECYSKDHKVGDCLQVVLGAFFATTEITVNGRLFVINHIESLDNFLVLSNKYMSIYLNKEDATGLSSNNDVVMEIGQIRLKDIIVNSA